MDIKTLRDYREYRLRETQERVALRAGVTRQAICLLEKGHWMPRGISVTKYARAYILEVDEMLRFLRRQARMKRKGTAHDTSR